MSKGPDEIFYFCQAIRMIYSICNDDKVARDRVFEMIGEVENDVSLTPMAWVERNSPLVERVFH